MESNNFPRTVYHIGTIVQGTGPYHVEWPTTIDPSTISSFVPDCGCTANVRIENDKVVGTYTDNSTGTIEGTKISKYITVNLTDSSPDFIINERGVRVRNPHKNSSVRLEIRALVVPV